jgi:hypothetical protein
MLLTCFGCQWMAARREKELHIHHPLVMPGLVPGIHVFLALVWQGRGWPGQARP